MLTPLEALADALTNFEGWEPESRSFRNRNPGNLRRGPSSNLTDNGGFAIYRTLELGRRDLVRDLEMKCAGNTSTGLGPRSTLRQLIEIWAPRSDGNEPEAYTNAVVAFLNRCGFHDVNEHTPLSYFQKKPVDPTKAQ